GILTILSTYDLERNARKFPRDDRTGQTGSPHTGGGQAADPRDRPGAGPPPRPAGAPAAGHRRRSRDLAPADPAPFREPRRAGAGADPRGGRRIEGPPGRGDDAAGILPRRTARPGVRRLSRRLGAAPRLVGCRGPGR